MAPQKIAHVKYGWIFRRIRENNTFPLAYAERGKIAKDEHVSVGQRDRSFTKKGMFHAITDSLFTCLFFN